MCVCSVCYVCAHVCVHLCVWISIVCVDVCVRLYKCVDNHRACVPALGRYVCVCVRLCVCAVGACVHVCACICICVWVTTVHVCVQCVGVCVHVCVFLCVHRVCALLREPVRQDGENTGAWGLYFSFSLFRLLTLDV